MFGGKYGMTLLAWAFYRDKRVIFQQLLKAGANPEAAFTETFDLHLLGEVYSGETVPELATRNWLYGYTSECLPYMRDVNKRNDRGHTLLLCLAKTKRDDARLLFEQLLNRNDVELNVTTKSGSTALDGAMSEKNYEYVVALLKAGAEVDAGYRNGYGFRENLDSRYDYAFENEDKDALKQLDEVKSLLKD